MSPRRRRIRPAFVVSFGVVVIGLVVATVATSLAFDAGEVPVTVLPIRGGLLWVTLARAAAVGLVWVAATRWLPRRRLQLLTATGLFWLLWGLWQAWVLLART